MKNIILCFLFLSTIIFAEPIILIDEEFGNNPPSGGAVWTSSDGTFEVYNVAGAGVRDMNATYDDDQNLATAEINIRGAIEVNANTANATLTAAFSLPGNLDPNVNGTLTFFAGLRNGDNGVLPTISIQNVTDGRTILAATNPTINANDNIWEFNSFSVTFLASDLGDDIQLIFTGGGVSSADGLEITDLLFTAEGVGAVPEPSTYFMILVLAIFGYRRRFKSK